MNFPTSFVEDNDAILHTHALFSYLVFNRISRIGNNLGPENKQGFLGKQRNLEQTADFFFLLTYLAVLIFQ